MFYSIQDNDCHRIMATGQNSSTREEAILAIFEYVQIDMDDDDRELSDKWPLQEKEEYITNLCNFEIIEHEKELETL